MVKLTKKKAIENYFAKSNFAISKHRLLEIYNISPSHLNKILLELIKKKYIVKLGGAKIKYYRRNDN